MKIGVLALVLLGATSPLAGQEHPELRGYLLNVAVWSDAGPQGNAGVFDLQRARVMATAHRGPWHADLAWESFVTLSSRTDAIGIGSSLGQASSDEWLPLQGRIASGAHGEWRHRADRLALRYAASGLEVTAGRQAISWATTLIFTPADPFAPFDPSDPFREYRAGVDAIRMVWAPGPFSSIEAVAREVEAFDGHHTTAAIRARTTVHGVDLAGWGGVVDDEAAGSAATTLTAAGAAFRGEVELRRSQGRDVVRAAIGVDRSWEVAGRTLYLAFEYQHDGFGANSAAGLPDVLRSVPVRRGELQALGRDELALRSTWQLHPLVTLEVLGLRSLADGSTLLAPAGSWSASDRVTLRLGAFIGAGKGGSLQAPGSEYGPVPLTLYASAAAFF